MTTLAKRLLIDAIFAALFARFSGVVRWICFAFGGIFLFGVVSSAVGDFRAHGVGRDVDLSQIEVQTRVNDRLGQVYWDVQNNSSDVVGAVQITCTSNGYERVIAPDHYIEAGRSASGVYEDSAIGYDTVCKLTSATGYRK